MIKGMTIDDYEKLFEMWKNTPNKGLRSLDDSKECIFNKTVCVASEQSKTGKLIWGEFDECLG